MSIQLTATPAHSTVGGTLHTHLQGTAACGIGLLQLRVLCDGSVASAAQNVPVASNGTWSADLATCPCGHEITIQARCEASPTLPWQPLWGGNVLCAHDCCPTADLRSELKECVDSLRSVKLVADVTVPPDPCPAVRVRWDFGDGGSPSPWTTLAPGTVTAFESTHRYPCGNTYMAALHISPGSDFTCPPQQFQVHVPCCGCCPTLSLNPTVGPCDASGNRSVKVAYTVAQPASPCPPVEGKLEVAGQTVAVNGPAPLSGTLTPPPLAPGQYTATLTLASPPGCPPVQAAFTVQPCDCCPASVVTAEVEEKCNADLTKHVKVQAVVTPIPGCPVQAEMSVEGTVVDTGSGAAPFTLEHEGDYDCGRHPVTIRYPGTDCPDGGGEFCVPVCESPQCKLKRMYFELAATVALLSLGLYAFNTAKSYLLYLAIVASVVAVILFLGWRPCLKRCRRCQLLLVLWEIALATFLGFMMLGKWSFYTVVSALSYYMSPVLAVILVILTLLLIAFVIYLLYRLWVARCCPTECERWTQVYETLTYVCLVGTAIVTAVITSQGDASTFVAGYVGIGVGFFITWVLSQKVIACKG